MKSPRLKPLPVEQWTPGLLETARTITNGGIRADANVYCTLANYPALFLAWLGIGAHVLRESSLPARERELLILRTTALAGGHYPFTQHVWIGAEHGLDDEAIHALLKGPSDAFWDRSDRALLLLADELIAAGGIAEGTWQALRSERSVEEILDAVVTVAFYRLAAWTLNLCGTPLDPGQKSRLSGSPLPGIPDATAFNASVRIEPIRLEDWPAWLLEKTARWPRFAANHELRQAAVYCTLANHPTLFAALGPMMAHLLRDISLTERHRELVIVRACALDRGAYPYRQHVRIGRRAGLSDTVLNSLATASATELEGPEQLLVKLVDSLHRSSQVDEPLWAEASACFSVEQLLDATVTAGFYGIISFVLNVARTELAPGDVELPQFVMKDRRLS